MRTFFFFNDTATTEIYTLSLHDALPIFTDSSWRRLDKALSNMTEGIRNIINEIIDHFVLRRTLVGHSLPIWSIAISPDRKSTRLNSSHLVISYAVFCLNKINSCP